jgi:FKBP-type peptidyl-prolyl cis-trans isomerase
MRFLIAMAVLSTITACGQGDVSSDTGKEGYIVGYQIGSDFKAKGIDIPLASMTRGLKDGMEGKTSQVNETDQAAAGQRIQTRARAKFEASGKDNLAKAQAYLDGSAKQAGMQTTKSGLQYMSVKEGTGPMPKDGESVKVHYVGTLIDGKKFDSSIDRGQPVTFNVNQVIPGWTEALKMMKTGSKWKHSPMARMVSVIYQEILCSCLKSSCLKFFLRRPQKSQA